jgi:bifunctional enzyme CysN/CysC
VLCVNKMDLVGYSQEVFDSIKTEFQDFAAKLEIGDLSFVPISALDGDNVVTRSTNMPWYEGASLLHMLEDVHIASDRNLIDSRFPVQYVIRPMSDDHHDYRGFAGTVAGGVFKVGDEVMVLPSGLTTTIAAIDTFDGPIDEAFPPMSVTIRLADDIDTSRGSMICRVRNQPSVGQDIDAMICWMADAKPIQAGDRYTIKHTTQTGRAIIKEVAYQLDVNSLHRNEHPGKLNLNELGRVTLRTTVPLFYDEYRRNRTTGSFILIDEGTNSTVGAGMILGAP